MEEKDGVRARDMGARLERDPGAKEEKDWGAKDTVEKEKEKVKGSEERESMA